MCFLTGFFGVGVENDCSYYTRLLIYMVVFLSRPISGPLTSSQVYRTIRYLKRFVVSRISCQDWISLPEEQRDRNDLEAW